MEALQQKVRSLEDAKINSANEAATNDREKRRLEAEAAELRRKIKEFEDQLSEVMTDGEGDDLEAELDQTKVRLEKARLDLQVKEANKFTYAAYVEEIDEMVSGNGNGKACCPTCNRAFKSEAEARELKADLEDIIAKIPSKVNSLRNKVKAEERRLEELQVMLLLLLFVYLFVYCLLFNSCRCCCRPSGRSTSTAPPCRPRSAGSPRSLGPRRNLGGRCARSRTSLTRALRS